MGGVVQTITDDVLGFDPGGGGIYSVARDVLGSTIADDVLGFDPNGGGIVPAVNTAANVATAYVIGQGVGELLAPELLAGTPTGAYDSGIGLDVMAGPQELGTGLTVGATEPAFVGAQSAPELSSMGGGTGLTTQAAGGGTLSAAGVTGTGAVPVLGSSGSFINNPSVLGQPVVGATASTPISLKDALDAARAANSIRNLLAQPELPTPNMLNQPVTPQGTVDYSSLLSLLAQKPRQANISSLLG